MYMDRWNWIFRSHLIHGIRHNLLATGYCVLIQIGSLPSKVGTSSVPYRGMPMTTDGSESLWRVLSHSVSLTCQIRVVLRVGRYMYRGRCSDFSACTGILV